jgi:hypothetical protein
MTAHMASAARGLPSVRIIVAGVRKMPTPTTWLTTIAVAVQGPRRTRVEEECPIAGSEEVRFGRISWLPAFRRCR